MLDNIDPTLIVLATLGVIVFLALAWNPSGYQGAWKLLADSFATEKRPRRITFAGEEVLVGSPADMARVPNTALAGFATFDVEVDEEGVWMLHDTPPADSRRLRLFVPGYKFTFVREKETQYIFKVDAGEQVTLTFYRELGEAVKRRCLEATRPPEP